MANVTYSSRIEDSVERRLQIQDFRGIDESAGVHNKDVSTSPDARNFVCENGTMRTAGGSTAYGNALPLDATEYLTESKPRIFQAFFRNEDGTDFSRLVATFNRSVYYLNTTTQAWVKLGNILRDGCDMLNYRNEEDDWAILTDGDGAAFYWNGIDQTLKDLYPTQGWALVRFQQISLLYERLFGAVYKDTPDRLYWSASFDPDNWEPDVSNAEDSAGFVDIATFDGSRIRAITQAFDDMLIFKDRTVHKIVGSYPGEWQLSQIFGSNGTLAPRSIVNTGRAVFFLTADGFCKYDGSSVYTLKSVGDRKLKDTWALLNASAIENACAAFLNNKIYLSVCLDADEPRNTHVIEYDITDYTYSIVELAGVDDWLVLREGQKETLLAIVWNQVYRYDSGATLAGAPINAVWTSPEFIGSSSSSKKQTDVVYLTVEAATLDVDREPTMKISMISGTRVKSRVIPLVVGVQTIKKPVRVKGRAFRFRIENQNGDPLIIHKGIEILVTEDFD